MSSVSSVEDNDEPLKICMLGPPRTGKTSIRMRLEGLLPFSREYNATVDIYDKSSFERKVRDGDREVLRDIDVWDTPGSRKVVSFKQLNAVLEDCDGVMFVFDLCKYSSLLKMEAYWSQVMEARPDAVTILVGNKNEDHANREVDQREAKELSNTLCCEEYFEVSAKTKSGMKQAVDCLTMRCMEARLSRAAQKKAARRSTIFSVSDDDDNFLMSPKLSKKLKSEIKWERKPKVDIGQWYIDVEERDVFLQTFREALRKGVTVLLYPHAGGSPTYAKLSLHKSNKRLCWENVSSSRAALDGLVINDIAEIRPYTELSYTFREMQIPMSSEGTNHLFTLVSSQKSISMAADTPENCIFLVKGLKLMVEKAIPSHIKRKRGKEPISEAKLMLLKNGKKRHEKFTELKSKLSAGVDVVSITKGINQRELFMFLDSSEERLVFSRRRKRAVTTRSSVLDSFFLYFEGPDPGINVDDISEIRPGYSLDSLDCKPPPHPSQEQLAISVIGSERTISILMSSTHERDYFVEKIQALIKAVRPSVSVY